MNYYSARESRNTTHACLGVRSGFNYSLQVAFHLFYFNGYNRLLPFFFVHDKTTLLLFRLAVWLSLLLFQPAINVLLSLIKKKDADLQSMKFDIISIYVGGKKPQKLIVFFLKTFQKHPMTTTRRRNERNDINTLFYLVRLYVFATIRK